MLWVVVAENLSSAFVAMQVYCQSYNRSATSSWQIDNAEYVESYTLF